MLSQMPTDTGEYEMFQIWSWFLTLVNDWHVITIGKGSSNMWSNEYNLVSFLLYFTQRIPTDAFLSRLIFKKIN